MYTVICDGQVLGLCDTPNYIRIKDGIFVDTTENEATGIAFGGAVYNYNGDVIFGAKSVIVQKIDGSQYVFDENVKFQKGITENSDSSFDLADIADENSMSILELADMVANLEERIKVIEYGK